MITIHEMSNVWTPNLKQSDMVFQLPTLIVTSEENGSSVARGFSCRDVISDIQVESSLYDIALLVCTYIDIRSHYHTSCTTSVMDHVKYNLYVYVYAYLMLLTNPTLSL